MTAAERNAQSAPQTRFPFVASWLRRYVASSGPITNMRKWGVSMFGTLRTFDFQPKNQAFLGPSAGQVANGRRYPGSPIRMNAAQ